MKRIAVVGAAILEGGRCFVAQRPPGGAMGHRWEFPGGKVERGEDPRVALVRELHEELSVDVEVGDHLGRGIAVHGDGDRRFEIQLDVYRATLIGRRRPVLREHLLARWCTAAELAEVDWAAADVPVVPAVAAVLTREAP